MKNVDEGIDCKVNSANLKRRNNADIASIQCNVAAICGISCNSNQYCVLFAREIWDFFGPFHANFAIKTMFGCSSHIAF